MPSFTTVLLATMATTAIAGKASYYTPNGGTGACGKKLQNNDLILALPSGAYANGKNCGKKIQVTYKGKSITGTVQDLCPGCAGDQVDLSEGWFKKYAPTSVGILQPLDWKIL